MSLAGKRESITNLTSKHLGQGRLEESFSRQLSFHFPLA
jgi:hypothetical protein